MNWQEKRKIIIERDNFTCTCCGKFDPSEGIVQLINENGWATELHEFINDPDPFQSIYRISGSVTGNTFEINFGNCWPVFPTLQVHHTRYIKNRESWDYDHEYLVTLCKKCHTNLHLNSPIPYYTSGNDLLLMTKKTIPLEIEDSKHFFEPGVFIKRFGVKYTLANIINPSFTTVLFEGENSKELEGKKVIDKLLMLYFPFYYPKNNDKKY